MNHPKTILITGSSTGLGRAAAETLARRGHTVFASMRGVAGRNAESARALEQLAKSEGLKLHVVELDVRDDASVQAAVAAVMAQAGQIDVLVNNAGVMAIGVSEAMAVEQLQAMLDVNVVGTLRVVQAVLPHMRARGEGLLVYVSSTGSTFCYPYMGVYGATKSAAEGIAESVHLETHSLGIDTVILQAGMFSTALGAHVQAAANAEVAASYGMVGQIGAGVVAQFPAMLASPAASPPALLADKITEILAMEPGSRPLRVPIGAFSEGLMAINPVRDGIQRQIVEGMGFGVLLTRPAR